MRSGEEFLGRSALISGGTSGINLGIARALAQLGANTAVFGRDADKAARAAAELQQLGAGRALGLSADVRDPEAVQRVVEEAAAALGPLDIVVAGAAGNFAAPAAHLSPKGFRTVVEIDLIGTFNLLRLAFPRVRRPQAAMIAISAPQAVLPQAFQAHVCAAKAGVNMLVKCLALEWGQAGVRVNAISPGPIADTEGMARLAPSAEQRRRVEQRTPLRRQGRIEEVAQLAVFLASNAASYVSGGIFTCDGGWELGDASADTLAEMRRPAPAA